MQGNIAEENHYYAYGLKIATLSSKKLGDVYEGSLKNNYLYQGAYAELDEDIGWTDFYLRNYDAQIGRWVQQDPYQEFASPYLGMGDDPVNLVDPSGGSILSGLSGVARVAVTTIGGAIIGTAVGLIAGDDDFTGTLIGAGVGLAAGLGSLVQQITLSMGISSMSAATTVINTSVKSEQVGRQMRGTNSLRNSSQGLNIELDNNQETNNEEPDIYHVSSIVDKESAWPIWPIIRALIPVVKKYGPRIYNKGIKPIAQWTWRQLKSPPIREIERKIEQQLLKRGWTSESLKNTLKRPFTTRSAVNKANGNPATAYYNKDGSYVVRDNVTQEIIQISNRLDPKWVPDATIINPYIPK